MLVTIHVLVLERNSNEKLPNLGLRLETHHAHGTRCVAVGQNGNKPHRGLSLPHSMNF